MNVGMNERERRGQRLASEEFVEEREIGKQGDSACAKDIFFSYLQFFFWR